MADPKKRGEEGSAGAVKGAFNQAADTLGGMVGMASASTVGSRVSEAFVSNASAGDLYEIEAGMMAARRGRSESVRAFGEMMIAHHTTSLHQMQSALMSSEVADALPDPMPAPALDARRQNMLTHLHEASDDDFDDVYLDQQRLAHRETVTLLRGYAGNGDNPQLRSVAAGGLPMVERHLKAIERIGRH